MADRGMLITHTFLRVALRKSISFLNSFSIYRITVTVSPFMSHVAEIKIKQHHKHTKLPWLEKSY